MARTILTTLTAKDYRDLKQNYSEKNIINQTNGNEYLLKTTSKINITDIHGASMSQPAAVVSNNYPNLTRVYHAQKGRTISGLWSSHAYYLRNEWYWTTGSFSIETDRIITNPKGLSVTYDIIYDKYIRDDNSPTGNSYDTDYSYYARIKDPEYKENDSDLTSSGALPQEPSKLVNELAVIGMELQSETLNSFASDSIYGTVQLLNNSHYKITVYYSIVTWWGSNYVKGNMYGPSESNETLLSGRQIDFTVTANTVEEEEVQFTYSRDIPLMGGAKGKNYEIKSNEFLQTTAAAAATDRPSYSISQEIFNKFDTDRTIVSFVLLNCEKYLVGDEYRYLQAEDLIYIKDENGEYLKDDPNATGDEMPAVFEVVKTRPIWNGSFEIEVTCRKVDSTT